MNRDFIKTHAQAFRDAEAAARKAAAEAAHEDTRERLLRIAEGYAAEALRIEHSLDAAE